MLHVRAADLVPFHFFKDLACPGEAMGVSLRFISVKGAILIRAHKLKMGMESICSARWTDAPSRHAVFLDLFRGIDLH